MRRDWTNTRTKTETSFTDKKDKPRSLPADAELCRAEAGSVVIRKECKRWTWTQRYI